jgi:protein required for attachment to host cells
MAAAWWWPDGAKMLFFRNEGDAEFLKLEVEQKREQPNLADRELMTDGHGSAPAAAGSAAAPMNVRTTISWRRIVLPRRPPTC